MNVLDRINANRKNKRQLAVLIDPDKHDVSSLEDLIIQVNGYDIDYVFVGGSLVNTDISAFIKGVKKLTDIPVILFPGSVMQISSEADAILFLSLISGRNPEYLIGHHVQAAIPLLASGIEVISTGYILIDGGRVTSVEYMSNTQPIPADKPDIVVSTAVAGEMLGNRMIYLEAGSGAKASVPFELIKEVKKQVSIPIIVGGGIKDSKTLQETFNAGADIVVIGTALEKSPEILSKITRKRSTVV